MGRRPDQHLFQGQDALRHVDGKRGAVDCATLQHAKGIGIEKPGTEIKETQLRQLPVVESKTGTADSFGCQGGIGRPRQISIMENHSHTIATEPDIELDHPAAAKTLVKGAARVFRIAGPKTAVGNDQRVRSKPLKEPIG